MAEETGFKKKAEYFKLNNMKVHIVLKNNKTFYNGKIDEIKEDLLIFHDRVKGKIPVSYQEIFRLEKFDE